MKRSPALADVTGRERGSGGLPREGGAREKGTVTISMPFL